jgi:integrase
VGFIVATSARWSEALNARREDIRVQDNGMVFVEIRGTKTEGSKRTVPIATPWQQELIREVLEKAEGPFRKTITPENPVGSGELFRTWGRGNMSRDLKVACKSLQVEGKEGRGMARCSPNDLRRTHASWMVQAGVDLHVVSKLLGHKTTAMVQLVYGRTTPESLAARMQPVLGPPPGDQRKPLPAPPTQ